MLNAVFDSTILVSAFLAPKGLAALLLDYVRRGAFTLFLSAEILSETQNSLLLSEDIRDRYKYPDQKAQDFVKGLHVFARLVPDLPSVKGVSRDPNDDHVIACALGAGVSYLVTRDKDLLDLKTYQDVQMIRPEEFIHLVRKQTPKP
jgi:putative PIN family toxin of toxin-antitoxin system